MLSTLKNAFKVPELKKRILFTLFLIAVYRLGSHIPVPGINRELLSSAMENNENTFLGLYNLMTGGAISQFNIFAMGVVPYINASIIMQLLTVAIPYLEQLSKEGDDGRKRLQKYTRNVAIVLGLIQAYTTYIIIRNFNGIADDSAINVFLIVITLSTASSFLMWLGDVITVKGLGNGVSLLIFINILSRFPDTIARIFVSYNTKTINLVQLIVFIIVAIAMIISVIIMSMAERRISVQYAGKTVGNKSFKGQSSHIPFNLTATAVIAIIFAVSVMNFPATIAQFFPKKAWATFITDNAWSPFNDKSVLYPILYAILVIFFSWFYAEIYFKPEEMAENIYKSAGFIPGIRPGKPTAKHISKVLTKVAIIGGVFATIIAIVPVIVQNYTSFKNISLGGTSILIMVSVAMETVRTLESQLVMRHYQGFLK
ncbi:MAG: preprotein translocase subunit SecY [Clostridiales bacterium]|uniref:preprotein translocase subunit SecY n=1 Tax=Clostridium sp. N3C TaxID=1776758 RepID=UPI00092E1BB2|nr:preprotein translocase subunit SecY [Clostridium sp. N3C]NLZ49200.1 preprotein translocase subunit SecY [Clostridiales bacterium]SCN24098.1 preprotein translocase subunit SecY [Clostridium sp. N3C]